MLKVIFAAGGTAGHINPAISIADYMKEKEEDFEALFIGTNRGLEKKLVPAAGYKIKYIDICGFDRKESEKQIEKINRERSTYYKTHTGREWDDVRNYDLCINTSEHGLEKSAQIILDYINVMYK